MGDPHAVRMQWMTATGIGVSKTAIRPGLVLDR